MPPTVFPNSTPSLVHVMLHVLQVADLDAGIYNITAKAVNADGTAVSTYSRAQYGITVAAPWMDPPDTTTMDGPLPTETDPAHYCHSSKCCCTGCNGNLLT